MPGEIRSPGGGPASSTGRRPGRTPKTAHGWWALGLAGVAVLSLVAFPLITMRYRETYPIVDTWVIPAFITLIFDTSFLLSLIAVSRKGERSLVSILVLALTCLAALVSTAAAVGGAIVGG